MMSNEIKHRIITDELEQAASEYKEKRYKFEAFISYRHLEPDQQIAQAVHKMIETFRAPKEFEINGQKPVFRVFRDREELAAKDLSDSIEDALKNSKYLIVICSRRLPLSEWCIKEIQTFRKLHGDERIIPVLIEGEPSESFPWPLKELKRESQSEDAQLQDILAADLRPNKILQGEVPSYESVKDPQEMKLLTKEALSLLKLEKYRIMATILGCSLGDLRQRDKERKNKLVLSISALVGAVFLIFGLFMANAYQKAERARQEAVQSNAAILMKSSKDFLEDGDSIKAILIAKEAMEPIDPSMENHALLKAEEMAIYNNSIYNNGFRMLTTIPTKNKLTYFSISDDSKYIAYGLGNNKTAIADPKNGELIKVLSGHGEQVKLMDFSPDSKLLASASFGEKTIIYDVESGETIQTFSIKGIPMMGQFSVDGSRFFQISLNANVYQFVAYDTKSWEKVGEFEVAEDIKDVNISPNGEELVMVLADEQSPDQMTRRKVKDGSIIARFPQIKEMMTLGGSQSYELISEYRWAQYSKDGKYLLAEARGTFIKYTLDGKKIFSENLTLYSEKRNLIETSKGQFVASTASKIYFINPKNGTIDREIAFPGRNITIFAYHEDTNTLIIVSEDGSMSIWKDGVILEDDLNYGRGVASEIQFLPDGSKLITNSRENQVIKIVDIGSSSNSKTLPLQLIAVSKNFSHMLYYDGKDFLISKGLDGQQEKVELNELNFQGYIGEVRGYSMSNDGNYISRVVAHRDAEGLITGYALAVYDQRTKKQTDIPLITNQIGYSFTSDSKKILIIDEIEGLRMIEIESQKTLKSYPDIKSTSYKILLSEDERTLVINRVSGTTEIIDFESGETLDKIPGEALDISNDNDTLIVKGIYNNAGYIWEKGQELKLFDLDEACAKTPISFGDLNLYNAKSNMLLMIRNNDIQRVGYIVDFGSGRLIATLKPSSSMPYRTNACFNEDGRSIAMDQLYYVDFYDNDGANFKNYRTMSIYSMLSEEEALSEIERICAGRELTDEEKVQIGISTK